MQKLKEKPKKEDVEKITMFVTKLNQYRHEYYNKAKPSVKDAVYDHLFDELQKLDGLTIRLVYENGRLVEASTRGDGDIGEVITHNISAFYHVPTRIPHKGQLVRNAMCISMPSIS